MTNHQETAAATPLMDATTAGNIPAAKRLRTGDGAVLVKQLEVVESSEQLETTLLTHKQPHAPTSAALPHITDASCGIISYMTPNLPAWSGILKYRFSDFIVREMDTDGNILRLTDMNPPAPSAAEAESNLEVAEQPPLTQEVAITQMTDLLGAEFVAKLKDLISTSANEESTTGVEASNISSSTTTDSTTTTSTSTTTNTTTSSTNPTAATTESSPTEPPASAPRFIVSDSIYSKEIRSTVHKLVKSCFAQDCWAKTLEGDKIQIFKGKECKKKKVNPRPFVIKQPKKSWEELGGDYLHFILYKENIETMTAVNNIAKRLRIPSKAFAYAGTKDKRSVSVQAVSVRQVKAESIDKIVNNSWKWDTSGKNMVTRVGNFKYLSHPLKLGDLSGNHFTITMRDVMPNQNPAAIQASVDALRESGFVNYFGMQRFGTRTIGTYEIGIALLKGEWEAAVDLILCPRGDDREDLNNARNHWVKNRDPVEAAKLFPKFCVAEHALFAYYNQTGRHTDHISALRKIPRNLLSMYNHSYQSLVWNHMVTRRLQLDKVNVILGDIVMLDRNDDTLVAADDDNNVFGGGAFQKVLVVRTKEEASKYTLEDVVLPLPGFDVVYPENEIKEAYVEFMAQHSLDPINMKRSQKEYSLPGSYRRIVERPKNVKCEFFYYNDPKIELSRTDIQLHNKVEPPVSVEGGEKLALVIEFSLSSSTYATMALREMTKTDTSSAFMTTLMDKSKKEDNCYKEEVSGVGK